MHKRILGAVIGVALTAALVGCGGNDKTSDATSATAQECKAALGKIFDRALAAGVAGQEPQISDDDKPAVCEKVADDAGRTILAEITREAGDKAHKQIQTILDAGGADASGSTSAAAATAGSAAASTGSAAASTGSAGKVPAGLSAGPATLPVGNAEWRLEKVALKRGAGGQFGGTYTITYLGQEESILAETVPAEILVYRGANRIATLLVSAGAPKTGDTRTLTVASADEFAEGPYTFELRFE